MSSASKPPAVWHSMGMLPRCLSDQFAFSGLATDKVNPNILHFGGTTGNFSIQPANLWFIDVVIGSSSSISSSSSTSPTGVKGARVRTLFIPDANKNADSNGTDLKTAVLKFAEERLEVAKLRDNLRTLRHVVSTSASAPQTTDDIVSMVAGGEQMVSGDVKITDVVMAGAGGPPKIGGIAVAALGPQAASTLTVLVHDSNPVTRHPDAPGGGPTVHLYLQVVGLKPEQTVKLWEDVEKLNNPLALVLPASPTDAQVEQMVVLALERSRMRRAPQHKSLQTVLADIDTNCNALNVQAATLTLP